MLGRRALCRAAVGAPLAAALGGCLSTRGTNVPTGQTAPPFSLASHDGTTVSLDSLLARGPAVLIFYRGHW